jgi:hypothetical protein
MVAMGSDRSDVIPVTARSSLQSKKEGLTYDSIRNLDANLCVRTNPLDFCTSADGTERTGR